METSIEMESIACVILLTVGLGSEAAGILASLQGMCPHWYTVRVTSYNRICVLLRLVVIR
jgi:hypothetical protein